MPIWRGLIVTLLAFPATLLGQRVQVRVVDQHDAPVSGVVLQLLDSTGAVVGRGLSDDRGEVLLAARTAGRYRIRSLRIGFRPVLSESIALSAGEPTVVRRFVLEGLPMRLDTMRVAGDRVCRAADSAAVAFKLWEQARTAIIAAELSATNRGVFATTLAYVRTLDPDGRRVRAHDVKIAQGYVTQPWRSQAPDSLHRNGFVERQRDGSTMYYAPGLDMLASLPFMQDHCFQFLGPAGGGTQSGVAFEPTPERGGVTDIRGTVWFDRATAELLSLEYQYETRSPDAPPAGGEMRFVHLQNGMWAVSHWLITVPIIENRIRSQALGGADARVLEISEIGGDLVLVRRGADTLWSRPPMVLTGIVLDSASGRPVANARVTLSGTSLSGDSKADGRFAISGVLPGEYTVDVHTPSLDSVNAIHRSSMTFADTNSQLQIRVPAADMFTRTLCGADLLRGRGVIVGNVVSDSDSGADATSRMGLRHATVSAAWTDATDPGHSPHWLDTRTTTEGTFRLCNVPVNVPVTLRALSPGARLRSDVRLIIPPSVRYARAELRLAPGASAAPAVFTGVVVTDSTRRPVAGAEVTLPDLGLTTLSNDQGSFRLNEVPAGTQHVVVRHIGQAALTATIVFAPGEVVNRRLLLGPVTTLDPMIVSETEIDRRMTSFEDHRHIGLGHFLTSAQLRTMEGLSTGAVLSNLTGLAFVRGHAGQQWVISSRAGGSLSATGANPRIDKSDQLKGAVDGMCYAHVYLDRMLVYAGKDEEPLFDVNSLAPSQIEAIEYYAGPAQTPPEYSELNSTCGILVIWTRRFQ